jgi:hypothetical protein
MNMKWQTVLNQGTRWEWGSAVYCDATSLEWFMFYAVNTY